MLPGASRLIEAASKYEQQMVAFIERMISIPSENPPKRGYKECVAALQDELRSLDLGYRVVETPEKGQSLMALHGSGDPLIYFHGHYDVVPACSAEQFVPRVEGGRIWGRGSADMKSGLAAMLFATRILQDCGVKLDGRIGLNIVPDEETAGELGTAYLVGRGLLDRSALGMFMPEPTSGTVWNGNRGAISLNVRVKGKPAHVGLHYEGINAFEHMLRVAGRLERLKHEISTRRTAYNIEPDEARASIMLLGGRVSGGTNFNLVPGECSFTVDRRINPEESLAEEERRLLDVLDDARKSGIDVDVEFLQRGESSGTGEEHPAARALADSIREVRGAAPQFVICPGLCEVRYYASLGIPAFAYGPGLLTVAHGPDEYVDIADVCKCAAVYAGVAARMLAH